MKKAVFVTNALEQSREAMSFAVSCAAYHGASLTALHIHDTSYMSAGGMNVIAGQFYVEVIALTPEEQKQVDDTTDRHSAVFMDVCATAGVSCHTHRVSGVPLDIVIRESRYADLLIIDPQLSFSGEKSAPTSFVKEVLAGAECPVLLAPDFDNPITEIVIAFDGRKASAYAAKQFCYLLPTWLQVPVTVLTVAEEGKDDVGGNAVGYLLQWLQHYAPSVRHTALSGNIRDVLFNYFLNNNAHGSQLLVAGAYGRTALSRLFQPGATDLLLKASGIPVFIAHS